MRQAATNIYRPTQATGQDAIEDSGRIDDSR